MSSHERPLKVQIYVFIEAGSYIKTIFHRIISRTIFNPNWITNLSLFSCPYFRNEIGGETERKIALTRQSSSNGSSSSNNDSSSSDSHTPALARGFSLLDSVETHWRAGFCPYRKTRANVIERIDQGATFYKNFFYGKGRNNKDRHTYKLERSCKSDMLCCLSNEISYRRNLRNANICHCCPLVRVHLTVNQPGHSKVLQKNRKAKNCREKGRLASWFTALSPCKCTQNPSSTFQILRSLEYS